MADDSAQPDGVSIDRSTDVPRRTDNRGVLHMIHDELGKALGIGQGTGAGKHVINGKAQTVDEAVDDAVKGAPAPGAEDY